ncbi:hypothetical protein TrVE_jg2133 [Triparma verrucosa]|uniref:Uncharacterized protein n=1 Tax=Triparma verrucosa TaxID=1606542 RepID=A0A9W7C817_9STRA|nr:hypothetical protein TrVE_jg2133 [Triparma verrucosa]
MAGTAVILTSSKRKGLVLRRLGRRIRVAFEGGVGKESWVELKDVELVVERRAVGAENLKFGAEEGGADNNATHSSNLVPPPMNTDIEMGEMGEVGAGEGGRSTNPLHDKKDLEKETSETKFKQHAEEQAKEAAMKGLGTGANNNEQAQKGMNADAMGKVMSGGIGGMELERLNIAINWLQNLGLVLLIDIPWPEAFKNWWTWVETLGLDFDMFGGMGDDISIALGLLVPAWLVWEFDAGLFWERTYFGFWFMNEWGHILHFKEGTAKYLLAVFIPVSAISLSCMYISEGRFSDLVSALILVLSGLSFLSLLHQDYLRRETKVCESAKEDFAKKRQENQMFFFLFFYTVAYLSGVSACTKLMVAKPEITNTYFYCENSTLAAEMEPEQRMLLVEPYNIILKDSSGDAREVGVFGLTDVSSERLGMS